MWYTNRQAVLTVRTGSLGVIPYKHGEGVILSKMVMFPATGSDGIDDTHPSFEIESPSVALAGMELTSVKL